MVTTAEVTEVITGAIRIKITEVAAVIKIIIRDPIKDTIQKEEEEVIDNRATSTIEVKETKVTPVTSDKVALADLTKMEEAMEETTDVVTIGATKAEEVDNPEEIKIMVVNRTSNLVRAEVNMSQIKTTIHGNNLLHQRTFFYINYVD